MKYIERIFERLKENEAIQHKFHQLESRIISTLNFKDFFETLLSEMITIFEMPYVWLTVIEESQLADLMRRINSSMVLKARTNFIKKAHFKNIISDPSAPMLVNRNLDAFTGFFPRDGIYQIKSMAIVPVEIDGEVVGSINQGDISPHRFTPDMDVSALNQLMLKISLCLSNVAAHERLTYFAYHDTLTGLLNRRAFETALSAEFNRSTRHGNDLSLVFVDLDSFKQINDTYGHDAGDMALKYVGKVLAAQSRKEDVVARFAGDEFVMMLPETARHQAEYLLKRLQHHMDLHPLKVDDHMLNISLSFGVAEMPDPEVNNPAMLLKKADENLYRMKAGKRQSLKKQTA